MITDRRRRMTGQESPPDRSLAEREALIVFRETLVHDVALADELLEHPNRIALPRIVREESLPASRPRSAG